MKAPEIAFRCPHCAAEATARSDGHGLCPACGKATELPVTPSLRDERVVDRCPACDGQQFYVQRDFNQRMGLLVVVIGGALAPFTPYYSSLFVAGLIDAALYAVLPEITICYRCLAHFRGFRRNPRHEPFDLHIAEQYGSPGVRS